MQVIEREIPALSMPEDLLVEFYGYPRWEDNGIGAYEFWGEVGHHTEMNSVCDEIFWDRQNYSDEENTIIKSYLNENYFEIATELEELFENQEY